MGKLTRAPDVKGYLNLEFRFWISIVCVLLTNALICSSMAHNSRNLCGCDLMKRKFVASVIDCENIGRKLMRKAKGKYRLPGNAGCHGNVF
jgi:hypothetical protein